MNTTFLRLLAADDKAAVLSKAIDAARAGAPAPDVYAVDLMSFRQIPGSPFAYWVGETIRNVFGAFQRFEVAGREVKQGVSTASDFQFVRAWWEEKEASIGYGATWIPFPKGGAFSPYYSDVHLLLNWAEDGKELKETASERTRQLFGKAGWSRWINSVDYYFRPGLTYPRRTTSGLSVRVMPAGCIFADKGPAIFTADDEPINALSVLAIVNSSAFSALVSLQLGAADVAARSYEVGIVQRTPVPELVSSDKRDLAALARETHDRKREADRDDEVAHPFTVPALVRLHELPMLAAAGEALASEDAAREQRLAEIQREIDDRCFTLYGFSDTDRAQFERGDVPATVSADGAGEDATGGSEEDDEDEDSAKSGKNGNVTRLPRATADLLLYALGCAFGRWDVRIGRDPALAPALADPFAPLPVCAPGALVGPDGLPATRDMIISEAWLRVRPDAITLPPDGAVAEPTIAASEYPIPVAWDGILPDNAESPNDVVRRLRAVLNHLWGSRASAIEQEACAILGVRDSREYLRNPRLFFDHHISRYSKSRRKAPIYWLLQSPKRSYGLWLYYHRLDPDLLFKALTLHLLPKIASEERRHGELLTARQQAGATGSEARQAALAVERHEALLADLRDFRDRLDRAAKLYLKPDLNDGVLLNIAPLWEVVPWKEAKTAWQQLLAGKYEWSSIGKQLREKGIVKAS